MKKLFLVALLSCGNIFAVQSELAKEYLALAYQAQKKSNLENAQLFFNKALKIDPTNTEALLGAGNLCARQFNYSKALEYFQSIPEINTISLGLYNAGFCHKSLGNFSQAITHYKRVLELEPNHSNAKQGLSQALLALGFYQEAWPYFEHRWSAPRADSKNFVRYMQDNNSLIGKTIVLRSEFGLGDTLQFIRYAQELKKLGATIIVESQRPLIPLLSLCSYIDQVIPVDTQLPPHHLACPLMSLPWAFNTTPSTIPHNIPYLQAKPELKKEWQKKLSHDKNYKIGLCWNGNEYDTADLQQLVRAKSIPLTLLEQLSTLDGISLYSLQKTTGTDQLKNLSKNFKITVFESDFDESHGRFMDTAALIESLDLVITIDTSIAHLAGALGKPVWLMLANVADWRWMTEKKDSPWYPNMQLFRQSQPGNWQSVVDQIVQELEKRVQKIKTTKNAKSDSKEEQDLLQSIFEKANSAYTQGNLELASYYFNQLLEITPNQPTVLYNAATAYRRLNKLPQAIECYSKALALKPDHDDAKFGLAQAYLAHDMIEEGWALFNAYRATLVKDCPSPANVANKTVLIRAEWGLGDMFHFIRYAKLLKEHKAKVIVESPKALTAILKLCPYIDEIIQIGSLLPQADFHIPLLYLPTMFKTKKDTIPCQVPYLQADPQLTLQWHATLKKDPQFIQHSQGQESFKIGICWDIGHHDTQFIAWQRSVPLENWAPLGKLDGISLYSLQKNGLEKLLKFKESIPAIDFGSQFDVQKGGFMDTAAVMKNLDLIITADTSIAHLAGGLGVPVWVLLPYSPDYRWTLQGDTTPWYPTMRLFRQKKVGDWQSVIQEVKKALMPLISKKSPQVPSKKAGAENPEAHIASFIKKARAHAQLHQFDQAIEIYKHILPMAENKSEIWTSIGQLYNSAYKMYDAIEAYKKAIEFNSSNKNLYARLAYAYQMTGQLEQSIKQWKLYDSFDTSNEYVFDKPMWKGESLSGKTILIIDEGGFGDLFHWIRYANLFKEQGAKVILQIRPAMIPIISSLQSLDGIVAQGQPLPTYDFFIPLGRIHRTAGTTLQTIPSSISYMKANEALVQQWHATLKNDTRFKIGLCWQCQTYIDSDTKQMIPSDRAIPLSLLNTLENKDHISLYNLAHTQGAQELKKIKNNDIKVFETDFDQSHGKFMDTAALIKNLDLVITVDTSVAHLAGAMGIPVWLLLHHHPDWRWFMDRTDSPWYPTMRIFRQPQPGDWHSVMLQVNAALKEITQKNIASSKALSFNELHDLGEKEFEQKAYDKALAYYDQALQLDPCNNGILAKKAYIYYKQNNIDNAIDTYKKILAINPAIPLIHKNLGHLLKSQQRLDDAIYHYNQAINYNPELIDLLGVIGDSYLKLGQLETGWQYWRKRFSYEQQNNSVPLWNGQDLQGKTILIEDQGGLGDTFQWIRLAQVFKNQGAKVIVHARPSIAPILSSCPFVDALIVKGTPLPHHDYYILSERMHCMLNTTFKTIPNNTPYLFANKELMNKWQAHLIKDTKFKIGICWKCQTYFNADTKQPIECERNIPLEILSSLAALPNVSVYSLQQVHGLQELQTIPSSIQIKTFGDNFDSAHGRFMDTAAVMKNLDLVITIDTSIAHLAGALNVPVWVLLPWNSDWRWFINRSDSPWYPSMKLFRQEKQNDWHSVMEKVHQELQKAIVVPSEKNNEGTTHEEGIKFDAINSVHLVDKLYGQYAQKS